MADGENHAKRTVLKRAQALSQRLEEGGSADPRVWSEAFSLLLEMVAPGYMASFITREDFDERTLEIEAALNLKRNEDACLELHNKEESVSSPFRLGPFTLQAQLTSAFGMFLAFLYFIGRGDLNWW